MAGRARSAAAGLPAARVRIRFAGVAGEWDTGIRRARMAAGPLAGTWATRAELRTAHGASWDAARVLGVRASWPYVCMVAGALEWGFPGVSHMSGSLPLRDC